MGIGADAASGPSDNAGKAKGGLDDAISAALTAHQPEDTSSALKEEDPKAGEDVSEEADTSDESTGEEASSEDAAKVKTKAKDEEETTTDPLSAPKHWPEADKQAFAKLPKEAQEIILRKSKDLEGGFTRKSQELSDKAKFADTVRGIFDEPTRQQIQKAGTDEVGYVRYLHSLQQKASTDPVAYIKFAMQNLGVTPQHLGITQAPSQQPPQQQQPGQATSEEELLKLIADPKVAQLETELSQLKSIIDRNEQAKTQAQHAERVNSVQTMQATIRSVREALDDTGQLAYPHFDAVQPHMAALMENDPDLSKMPDSAEKLQKAYDMAVWSRPDLRQSLIKTETQKEMEQARKKQDAQRAKKATGIKPAAGVGSVKPKTNSLDDALTQSMSKFGL
jgi:hypothetical protein